MATRAQDHQQQRAGAALSTRDQQGKAAGEVSARYLSEDQRVRIADLDRQGLGVRTIGQCLGRSAGTVSRELQRNRDPESGQYRPFAAQRLALARRPHPGRGKLVHDPVLRDFVAARLQKRWSPGQVCQAIRREFPDQPARHVCTRRSTRRYIARSGAGCAGNCRRCCAHGGDAASRTGARTCADPASWPR